MARAIKWKKDLLNSHLCRDSCIKGLIGGWNRLLGYYRDTALEPSHLRSFILVALVFDLIDAYALKIYTLGNTLSVF